MVEAVVVSFTMGGRHSATSGACAYTASGDTQHSVRMRTEAALLRTRALTQLVPTRPKSGWCGGADANGKIRCRSFLFLFFRETVNANEGRRPAGRSAAQLATCGLTDVERTTVVEH
jgi:hypothetical protein